MAKKLTQSGLEVLKSLYRSGPSGTWGPTMAEGFCRTATYLETKGLVRCAVRKENQGYFMVVTAAGRAVVEANPEGVSQPAMDQWKDS